MATFHPAYVLRQRGDDLTNTKRLVWKDIQNVHAEYQKAMEGGGSPKPRPNVTS
jgi:DNA polymerase